MNWGAKYCQKYMVPQFNDALDSDGKVLVNRLNACLRKNLNKYYMGSKSIRCKRLYDEAFEIQAKCYEENIDNFCKGFSQNISLFMQSIEITDFMNFHLVKMIRNLATKCDPPIDLMSFVG
jgi:hypothetical protein